MQHILSLHLGENTAHALIIAVQDRRYTLVEKQSQDIGPWLEGLGSLGMNGEQHAHGDLDAEQDAPEEKLAYDSHSSLIEPLQTLIASIETPWDSSIVIAPTPNYLSLNLSLPFQDKKNIRQVLDLEVQDLVPFDLSEFLIEHSLVSEEAEVPNDIHVSLIPKTFLRALMQVCQEAPLEPQIVTTNSSALGAIYHLAPEYYSSNTAVLLFEEGTCSLCINVNGRIRSDRALSLPEKFLRNGSALDPTLVQKTLLGDIKLSLTAQEKRYGMTIGKIYSLGSQIDTQTLQQSLGRNVEQLKVGDLIRFKDSESLNSIGEEVASLAAVFAHEEDPPTILTNFRTREFAHSPVIKFALGMAQRLAPLFSVLIGLFLVAALALYGVRYYQLQELNESIREATLKVQPSFINKEAGSEINALSGLNSTLKAQLEALGSPSQLSPLDSFLEISKDIAKAKKRASSLDVTKIRISSKKIILEGTASDYSEVERLENVFKQSKKKDQHYCRVNRETKGSTSQRNFEITIFLCED